MATLKSRVLGMGRTMVTTGAIVLAGLFPVLGNAGIASAVTAPTWDVRGNYTINFHCLTGCSGDYPHAMNVASENLTNGDFAGYGNYIPDTSYTWSMTGNTSGDSLTFTIVYTATAAGSTYTLVGTIDENGAMSGTASGMGQTFTWSATSGTAQEAVGNGVKPTECTGTYTNVIHGTNNGETLKGTAQADLIFGYGGNDTIRGLSGNDCLVGGMGNDTIDGGSADDVVLGKVGNDTLKGGAGNDTVLGGSGNDTLKGDAGADSLTGNAGTDSADGGTGTDGCSAETTKKCE